MDGMGIKSGFVVDKAEMMVLGDRQHIFSSPSSLVHLQGLQAAQAAPAARRRWWLGRSYYFGSVLRVDSHVTSTPLDRKSAPEMASYKGRVS